MLGAPMASPAFELGWVMAQLFDPSRYGASSDVFSFDPRVQLPGSAALEEPRKRAIALGELVDLIGAATPGVSADDVMAAALADPIDADAYKSALRDLHQAIRNK